MAAPIRSMVSLVLVSSDRQFSHKLELFGYAPTFSSEMGAPFIPGQPHNPQAAASLRKLFSREAAFIRRASPGHKPPWAGAAQKH